MDYLLCILIHIIVFLSRFWGRREKWRPGEKIRILLVGYNGARNTGSDVRVAAIAGQLAELFGKDRIKLTVMTLDAGSLEGYFDEEVELFTFSSFFPVDLLRACSRHHAVVLCEGSTLKSTFANALTLFICEAAGIMAAQKKPCIAYGSEVGAMEPFVKTAASRLCRDTYFITRTRGSLRALKKLRLKGHAGTDAAWSYEGAISASEAERLLRQQGWDGKKPLLGLAVIDPFCWPVRASVRKWIRGKITGDFSGQYDKIYFFSESKSRRKAFERYIHQIASAANVFLQEQDFFPVLIGMEHLDAAPVHALAEQLNCPGAVFLSGDTSADIMVGVLRRLDALVTSRYHAAVLSMEGGVPFVGISMDERLDGIMQELKLDRKYLLHTKDAEFEADLLEALRSAHSDRQAIRRHILAAVPGYRKSLDDMGRFMKRYIEQGLKSEEKR